MKSAENSPALLLTLIAPNPQSIEDYGLVTVWQSEDPKTGTCTLQLAEKGGQQHYCNATFDEEGLVNAVCYLLDQSEWGDAEIARQRLINARPDMLSRSSITKIVLHMLAKAGHESNAPTIEEFMTHRYTEL